jgi:hypothetical protein
MPPRNPLISLPGRKIPAFRSGNCVRAYPEFPDGHYLVSIRKRSFFALTVSTGGLACAAYLSMPPRKPLVSLPEQKNPRFRIGNRIRVDPELPDGRYPKSSADVQPGDFCSPFPFHPPKRSRYAPSLISRLNFIAEICSPKSTHHPPSPTDDSCWAGGMGGFRQFWRYPALPSSWGYVQFVPVPHRGLPVVFLARGARTAAWS